MPLRSSCQCWELRLRHSVQCQQGNKGDYDSASSSQCRWERQIIRIFRSALYYRLVCMSPSREDADAQSRTRRKPASVSSQALWLIWTRRSSSTGRSGNERSYRNNPSTCPGYPSHMWKLLKEQKIVVNNNMLLLLLLLVVLSFPVFLFLIFNHMSHLSIFWEAAVIACVADVQALATHRRNASASSFSEP